MLFAFVFVVSFFLFVGCYGKTAQSVQKSTDIFVQYHYTAEATYQDIMVNGSSLVYTYFDDTDNKCAQWVAQAPCWNARDLKTKNIVLSATDITELQSLVNETGFMELDTILGRVAENRRYYSYTLTIKIDGKEKEVEYRSFPGAEAMPEAFEGVRARLFELLKKE